MATILGVVSISLFNFRSFHKALTSQIKGGLDYTKSVKSKQIHEYITRLKEDTTLMADSRYIEDMVMVFQGATLAGGNSGFEDIDYNKRISLYK